MTGDIGGKKSPGPAVDGRLKGGTWNQTTTTTTTTTNAVSTSIDDLAREVLRTLGAVIKPLSSSQSLTPHLDRIEALLELTLPTLPDDNESDAFTGEKGSIRVCTAPKLGKLVKDGVDRAGSSGRDGGIFADTDVWVPSVDPPFIDVASNPVIEDSDDNEGYEPTLFEEYGPFDDVDSDSCATKSEESDEKKNIPKVEFYRALGRLFCEGFRPGSILDELSSSVSASTSCSTVKAANGRVVGNTTLLSLSSVTNSNTELGQELLLTYSLPRHHESVRSARILDALAGLDTFSVRYLVMVSLSSCFSSSSSKGSEEGMSSGRGDCESGGNVPLLKSFLHHLATLPALEGEIHGLQRRARNIHLGRDGSDSSRGNYGSSVLEHLSKAEAFTERTDRELAEHVSVVASRLLTVLYRESTPPIRGYLRCRMGAMLHRFAYSASVSTRGIGGMATLSTTVSSSNNIALYGKNPSASGIADVLLTLHRIILGFDSPALKKSHVSLLMDVLIPLHRPNGMVLWRDQTPVLELYHEPLVRCISAILNFDSAKNSGECDAGSKGPLVPGGAMGKERCQKQKDSSIKTKLLAQTILALLHPDVWPEGRSSNTPKVVLLLHEIDTLLQRHYRPSDKTGNDGNSGTVFVSVTVAAFRPVVERLILRMCECIRGDNSRTSERALQMWKSPNFEALVGVHLSTCIRPLLRALCRADSGTMEPSWNPTVNKMTALVLSKLESRNPDLFRRAAEDIFADMSLGGFGWVSKRTGEENEENQSGSGVGIDSSGRCRVKMGTESSMESDISDMVSLKGAMAGWKPPPRRRPGTRADDFRGGLASAPPPSTITGVAPWGKGMPERSHQYQRMKTGKEASEPMPPLTVTGVAPWAVVGARSKLASPSLSSCSSTHHKQVGSTGGGRGGMVSGPGPPPRPDKKGRRTVLPGLNEDGSVKGENEKQGDEMDIAEEKEREENASMVFLDDGDDLEADSEKLAVSLASSSSSSVGLAKIREFLKRIQPEKDEDGSMSGSKMSSWAVAQLSESPTLLTKLKFHDLVFGHNLGQGAFGTVRYARQIVKEKTRSHWPEFAVKVISTQKIMELGYESSVNREIAILRTLSHPGIARLISSFRFRDGAYLILEFASGGDLYELLRKNGPLDASSTKFVVGEVTATLRSIHEFGLVYGDLKPENILICESGHVKLTDFGACRPITEEAKKIVKAAGGRNALRELRDGDWRVDTAVNSEQKTTREKIIEEDFGYESISGGTGSMVYEDEGNNYHNDEKIENECSDSNDDTRVEGTTAYLPPEVAAGGIPTFAADAWALGCVLYQCLSGKPPLLDETEELTRHKIVTFEFPDEGCAEEDYFFGHKDSNHAFNPESKGLIRRLLCRNLKDRPDMILISEDPFFEGMDVLSLFAQPSPPLKASDVAVASKNEEDKEWNRRQFSSIWAPQPRAYSFDTTKRSVPTSSQEQRMNAPIPEKGEGDSYFLPPNQVAGGSCAVKLSQISE